MVIYVELFCRIDTHVQYKSTYVSQLAFEEIGNELPLAGYEMPRALF